jgi:hypothetical protein
MTMYNTIEGSPKGAGSAIMRGCPRLRYYIRDQSTRRFLIALVLAGSLALACGCVQTESNPGTGILAGTLSIGPLCPVEPCSIPPERLAAAYETRPIIVSTQDGRVIASVVADPVAGYSLSLKPGTYVVDVPDQGIGGSREMPKTVTIRNGETVRLDISIDTGIR